MQTILDKSLLLFKKKNIINEIQLKKKFSIVHVGSDVPISNTDILETFTDDTTAQFWIVLRTKSELLPDERSTNPLWMMRQNINYLKKTAKELQKTKNKATLDILRKQIQEAETIYAKVTYEVEVLR